MKRTDLIVAAILALGACATAPIIADLESDKVQVQVDNMISDDMPAVMTTANEGCGIHGRQAVGPLSARSLNQIGYPKVYLFACK